MSSELEQAVRAVVHDCLGVREREDVLVIANPATNGLGERLMSVDIAELRRRSQAVTGILTAGNEARITCPNGSDLTLSLEERAAISDDGELTEPGAFGNLPCGEGFIAPRHDAGSGRLVVDGI